MPPENRFNWGSFGQLLLSLFGMLFGLGGAGLLALFALIPLIDGTSDIQQATGILTMVWGGLLVAALCLPSAAMAVRSLMGYAPLMRKGKHWLVFTSLLLLLWPLTLALANAAAGSSLAWLFLPPLLILVVGIPVLWLTRMVRQGLPAESAQRLWGVACFGLVISPTLILLIQILVLIMGVVGFGIYLSGKPELLGQLQALSQSFTMQSDPNLVLEKLNPYLEQPGVVALGIFFISGLVPLIEEMFKPLGVWFLAGRKLTPAAGFGMGALSGGMFALLESLGYLSGAPVDGFVPFALARAGTMLLHVTTAGLVGWGLGSALGEKRYLRLGLAYLGAVLLHGVWNTVGVMPGLAELSGPADRLQVLASVSPYLLGGLSLLMVVILVVLNRRLHAPDVSSAQI